MPRRSRRATTRSPASRRRSRGTSTGKAVSRQTPFDSGASRPRPGPVLHFIAGKGGVGKTTCAAALALAEAAAGRNTLLVSTDPASSLADALASDVGASPRALPRRPRLHVADIDARRVMSAWLARRRPILARIALRGTWLDREDVARLLRLSLPGIDEIAALLEISRHARSSRYDVVVVDTAPTGHTLRMLRMPLALRAIARVFDDMQSKHRVMAEALRGRWEPDAADDLIQQLDADGQHLTALLRDRSRVSVSWVTIPETLAIAETLDALHTLADEGIPVTRLIVNRVTPRPSRPCRWCMARRSMEGHAIAPLGREYPAVPLAIVPTRAVEPRGARALITIAGDLARPARLPPKGGRLRHARPSNLIVPRRAAAGPRALDAIDAADLQLLMFGGKGGVGKTTCAAAAALAIAKRHRRRRVLLLSTDPAHSLGDALGEALSDEPRRLPHGPENLRVRELDATRGFEQVRARYGQAIDAMFGRLARGSHVDATHDHRVMRDLIDLAPPGLDEIAGVLEVVDALAEGGTDLVVVDTAPTGHALRLLQMPAVVQDWTKALMSILLKYQAVVGVSDLGPMLLRLSRGTGRLRQLLSDGRRTRFVAVTRAAALPREETVRLVADLHALGIAVPSVIVNATGAGSCDHCHRILRAERTELRRLTRALRPRVPDVLVCPAQMPPPRGVASLAAWERRWTAL